MKPYKTLLFDADNTLLDFTRSEREALTDTLTLYGLPCTEDVIATYSRINDAHWKRLERGEITRAFLQVSRFACFLEACGLHADPEKMAVTYPERLATKSFLIPGAEEVTKTLAKTYDLYIITNGNASVQHGRFDPSPIRKYFRGCFISQELGAEKPSSEFFDIVKKSIPGFRPELALVIGDSLTSDICGGVNAGIDTCWYNPKSKQNTGNVPVTYEIRDLRELLTLLPEH